MTSRTVPRLVAWALAAALVGACFGMGQALGWTFVSRALASVPRSAPNGSPAVSLRQVDDGDSLPSPVHSARTEAPTPPNADASDRGPGVADGASSPSASPPVPLRADTANEAAATTGESPMVTASMGGSIADAVAYAKARLSDREYVCLDALIRRESNWRIRAENGTSGAYGWFQAYPASRLDAFGDRDDPIVQMRFGLGYVPGRYGGSACRALDHALMEGWY